MELFIGLLIYMVLMVPLYFLIQFIVRRGYRDAWVQRGRDWRLKGYDHIDLGTAWIQKYFDEGYYELDRIVEGVKK